MQKHSSKQLKINVQSDDRRENLLASHQFFNPACQLHPPSAPVPMKHPAPSPFRFECTQCGQCCSRPGVVMITNPELVSIAHTIGVNLEYLKRICLDYDGEHWLIEVNEGEHCPFLENDRCSVHAVKPEQCRTYPFWPEIVESLQTWQAEAPYCPGIGRGPAYTTHQIRELTRGNGSTG